MRFKEKNAKFIVILIVFYCALFAIWLLSSAMCLSRTLSSKPEP